MSNSINWEKAYTQSAPKLLGVCRRYVNDINQAEDIVQDSFIMAIQKESLYKGTGSLEAWLSRIVINNALAHLKSKDVKNTINLNFDNEIYDEVDTNTLSNIDEKQTLSEVLNNEFDQNELLEAIDLLPIHHKLVFNMYVIDNLSHQQISNALDISVSTSKSHLLRARKKTKEILMEKLQNNRNKENKRRLIAILIFLGFGDRMFANKFRNSFKKFEIKPVKPFDPAKHINNSYNIEKNTTSKSISYFSLKKIIILLGTVFLISLIGYLNIFKQGKSQQIAPIIKIPKKTVLISEKKSIDKFNEENKINSKPTKTKKSIIKPTKSLCSNKFSQKKQAENDTLQKKYVNSLPIIIKKKIIKRDTIYVAK